MKWQWLIATVILVALAWISFVGFQRSRSGSRNCLIRLTSDRLEVIDEAPFHFTVGGPSRNFRKPSEFDWFTGTYRFSLELPAEHRGAPHDWEPQRLDVWHHILGAEQQLPYRCESEKN